MPQDYKNNILVVDDSTNNLKLVQSILSDAGYIVRLATSGQMAIASCRSTLPDLILLDISMPGMDGFEVCRILKKDDANREVPIIFLSALKEEVDVVHGFNEGGIDFVTKPFNAEILKSRVKTHLTINHLQRNLKDANDSQAQLIDARTKELQQTNLTLKEEIKHHVATQERYVESRERLNYALNASNEGIFDWDVKSDKVFRNETSYRMLVTVHGLETYLPACSRVIQRAQHNIAF